MGRWIQKEGGEARTEGRCVPESKKLFFPLCEQKFQDTFTFLLHFSILFAFSPVSIPCITFITEIGIEGALEQERKNKSEYSFFHLGKRKGKFIQRWTKQNYPGGSVVKNMPANAEDMGLIPGLGRSDMPWGQLSPCPTITSINHWALVPRACALQWEAIAMKSPHTAMKSTPTQSY